VPVEKCFDVPKEACSKIFVPRRIDRVSTRLYCDGSGNNFGSFGYTDILVVGGKKSASDEWAPVEVVSLKSANADCDAVAEFPVTKNRVVGGLGLQGSIL
jgi:hypothetical protein